MCRKRKKYIEGRTLCKYDQELGRKGGRREGSWLEAGIELVEMAEGISKNRKCLFFGFKFLRALTSPEPQISSSVYFSSSLCAQCQSLGRG